jgi:hypothetical protein
MTEASHFTAGSALLEFIAGRLGAPACWPNELHRKRVSVSALDDASSIQRWETEGGRTIAATALANRGWAASENFHTTRPLLTQLI